MKWPTVKKVVSFIFIILVIFTNNSSIFAKSAAYDKSERQLKEFIERIEIELQENHLCEHEPTELFTEWEKFLFRELSFLRLNEKRHFIPHPDFDVVLTYCEVVEHFEKNDLEKKWLKLGELKNEIRAAEDEKATLLVEKQIVETDRNQYRKRTKENTLKLIKVLITLDLGGAGKTFFELWWDSIQEKAEILKGHRIKSSYVNSNKENIHMRVIDYLNSDLKRQSRDKYPKDLEKYYKTIRRKIITKSGLNNSEESFLRTYYLTTIEETDRILDQRINFLKGTLRKKREEEKELEPEVNRQMSCKDKYLRFCERLRKYKLWKERKKDPKIRLTKSPSASSVTSGDTVTYTLTVTNPGNCALSSVTVTDDSCGPVVYITGDDGDSILDTNETWFYECSIITPITPITVIVPDVRGLSKYFAEKEIKAAKLVLGDVLEEESTQSKGLVSRQSPDAGTSVVIGSKIPTGTITNSATVEATGSTKVTDNATTTVTVLPITPITPITPVDIWLSKGQKKEVRRLFIDPPTKTIEMDESLFLKALLWYTDGSEVDVTRDPTTIWAGAPGGVFKPTEDGTFHVSATHGGVYGTATIHVRWPKAPSYSPPISHSDDDWSKPTPKPPPDAYTWYAVCDKKVDIGAVTYKENPDPIKYHTMAGPFPGQRTVRAWIEQNCPSWRCDFEGACATEPPPAPTGVEGQYVLCNKTTGAITVSKHFPSSIDVQVMAGPLLGEPAARMWIAQNCPSGRCKTNGKCATDPARGGKWAVVCDKRHGGVGLTKDIDYSRQWVLSEGFLGEPDARMWIGANCPSWRCNRYGKCLPGKPYKDTTTAGRPPFDSPFEDFLSALEDRDKQLTIDRQVREHTDFGLDFTDDRGFSQDTLDDMMGELQEDLDPGYPDRPDQKPPQPTECTSDSQCIKLHGEGYKCNKETGKCEKEILETKCTSDSQCIKLHGRGYKCNKETGKCEKEIHETKCASDSQCVSLHSRGYKCNKETSKCEKVTKVDCKELRTKYHTKCREVNHYYHGRNCKVHGSYSDCANDYVGCMSWVPNDAFTDKLCDKPGYTARGEKIFERYLDCKRKCNEKRISRDFTKKIMWACSAKCEDQARTEIKKHNN